MVQNEKFSNGALNIINLCSKHSKCKYTEIKKKENQFMKNRERNERIEIRLTEDERTIFEKKMKMAKCKTMSHFIRKCVMESEIYIIDLQPFREIQGLLFRYASSVNQIAKRVNSTGVIYSDDIKDMQSQIEHLSKEIWDIHSLLIKRTK